MSWFKALRTTLLAAIVLGNAAGLAACSFTPIYSGTLAEHPSLNLAYAKPGTRLEQVIYQELSLRLGHSDSEMAPLATIAASSSSRELMVTTTTNPSKPMQVTVTATLTLKARDGSKVPPQQFTRTAMADYTRTGQVLADNAAAEDAAERAAKSVAESLRLAVLAALSR